MEEKYGKTEALVGMEPADHYWLPLEQYLK
jgi:hypothetical protein